MTRADILHAVCDPLVIFALALIVGGCAGSSNGSFVMFVGIGLAAGRLSRLIG
jgi:hypothetical protein